MAYEKQTWVDFPNTSTPIEASRLNHMEQGIYEANLKQNKLVIDSNGYIDLTKVTTQDEI